MRKVRYSVAASLDGFIAGPNGEHDWIVHDPSFDWRAFAASVDTVLLGRKTFEAAKGHGGGSMPGMRAVVFSRTLRAADHPGVMIHSDAVASVRTLREQDGKDIWLMGGGGLFRSLLEAKLVDAVEVALVPVLLGAGIPLLPGPFVQFDLSLTSSQARSSGLVMLTYQPLGDHAKRPAVKRRG